MSGHPDDESHDGLPAPLEQAVELLVYAPLGFALDLREQFPAYVARGRREVRSLRRWLQRRAEDAVRESDAALRGLGRRADHQQSGRDGPEAPTLSVVPDVPAEGPPAPSPVAEAEPAEPALDADHLAIPGYESLSASQVVPRLVSLTAEELEDVRRYEAAARGRKTILSRIAQLQAG